MSHKIRIGQLQMGGEMPLIVQTMITASTMNADAVLEQYRLAVEHGAGLVRMAVQSIKEAQALKAIKETLIKEGISVPLCADVHFNAEAAMSAALYADKVRINPGNFLGSGMVLHYEEALRHKLTALLSVCRDREVALRVGVNHGSLGERILREYGNTPAGMVESAMEYLRICKDVGFDDVAVSLKASGSRLMVYANRLLLMAMEKEIMDFPLHLGVTEAGEGEDGRIKSAVGIGALLLEGIGDTIRVSLTEPIENEIRAAQKLVLHVENSLCSEEMYAVMPVTDYVRRQTEQSVAMNVGGKLPVAVWADLSGLAPIYADDIKKLGYSFNGQKWEKDILTAPDVIYIGGSTMDFDAAGLQVVGDDEERLLRCDITCLSSEFFEFLKQHPDYVLLLENKDGQSIYATRLFFRVLEKQGVRNAVVLWRRYECDDYEDFQLRAAADCGALLIDGYGDGIMLTAGFSGQLLTETAFAVLQAVQVRVTKTEYVACPGCGRTLFDIEQTLKEVKQMTGHLVGLKIGVMGCVVNGPGEMADADYGVVGCGGGMVALYRAKECVKRSIRQEDAAMELVHLIAKDVDGG